MASATHILGLDIGEKRIGVAIAAIDTPFPAPLITLEASEHLAVEFTQLLNKYHVKAVIVGLPRNQSGERTAQTDRVEKVAELLKIPTEVAVYWQDESLTSVKAEEELKKRKKPYAKAAVDSLAATYILEDFITHHRTQLSHGTVAQPSTDNTVSPVTRGWMKRHKLLVGILSAGILVMSAIFFSGVWYLHALSPKTTEDAYAVVSIKSGAGVAAIADELVSKNVIRNATAFKLYVRLHNIQGLQAGEYRLSSKQSASDIAAILSSGKVTTVNVLIPPGQRLDQIKATLIKDGFQEKEVTAAFEAARSHPLLKNVPSQARLEGYLFPDTYQIGPSTSAEQLVRLMLDTFQKRISDDSSIHTGIAAQGLTLEQAVIVASIVQKEVPDYETQRTVAQVFLRRLKEGVPLGADPTFRYAAAVEGGPSDPSNNSRYNTRKYVGLPPTAISNFNISALKAVANPSSTNYLYFVAGDDNVTRFSHTLEEHEALTKKYCSILCN